MTTLDERERKPGSEATSVTSIAPPNAAVAAIRVSRHYLTLYKTTWHGTLFSVTLLPFLYLMTFGIAVGAYVGEDAPIGDITYLEFVAPGLLCATVIMMLSADLTFPVFGGYKEWGGHYLAQRATPLRPVDLLNGQLLYALGVRLPFGCILFTIVVLAFGVYERPWMSPVAILAAVGIGLATGPWVFFLASWIKKDQNLVIVQRLILVPMTLFSGVFYPVSQMPNFILPLIYASPMWHGVEIARYATAGASTTWPIWANILYLATLCATGWLAARHIITKRLSD